MPEGESFVPQEVLDETAQQPQIEDMPEIPRPEPSVLPEATDPATIPQEQDSSEDAIQPDNEAIESSTEENRTKEVPQERQRRELSRAGATILNQEIMQLKAKVAVEGPDAIKTPGDRALLTFEAVQNKPDGVFSSPVDLQADTELGQPDISIQYKGQDVLLLNVTSRQGEVFGGTIRYKDGSMTTVPVTDIPASELTKGFFKAEGDLLTASLPDGAAKQVVESYIKTTVTGEEIPTDENTNDTILSLAQERGILTVDDFVAFFKAREQQGALSESDKQALQELQTQAQTSNLLLEDEVGDLLTKMNIEDSDQVLPTFIQTLALGKIDSEKASGFLEAMRSGNIDAMINSIASGDDSEEAAQSRKELAAKIAAAGALGFGAILMIMWDLVQAESKAVKQAVK